MKGIVRLFFIFIFIFIAQSIFAATFTTDFTNSVDYTNDSEIDVSGGVAKIKNNPIFQKASAYWKLNEASGVLIDSTGNGNNGTAINNPTYGATGRGIDTVLEFSGVSQRIDVPNSSDVSMGYGTWEAWIYPTSFSDHAYHAVISKNYSSAYWFGLYNTTGKIQLWVGGTAKFTSIASVSLNTWSHIVATWDGSNIRFYINGALVETIANSSPIKTNSVKAGIGADESYPNLYEFTGRIGEVALYNGEVLSDSEILQNYNNGLKKYNNGIFTITKTTGNSAPHISTFTSFIVTQGVTTGTLSYQISNDGINWKYWDGSTWSNAGASQSNIESIVNTKIGSFPSTLNSIYVKTFMASDGNQSVELDKIQIDYTPNQDPTDIQIDGGGDFSIDEGITIGTSIGTFTTVDADIGDIHTYTLVNGTGDEDNSRFQISGDQLKLNFSPDYENPVDTGDIIGNNTYTLRVQTDDGNGGIYQKSFILTINDIVESTSSHSTGSSGSKRISRDRLLKIFGKSEEEIDKSKDYIGKYECNNSIHFYQNMKIGDMDGKYSSWQGEKILEVKKLQEYLDKLGFNVGPIDGIYGTLTFNSVKELQRKFYINIDGFFGKETRSVVLNCENNNKYYNGILSKLKSINIVSRLISLKTEKDNIKRIEKTDDLIKILNDLFNI